MPSQLAKVKPEIFISYRSNWTRPVNMKMLCYGWRKQVLFIVCSMVAKPGLPLSAYQELSVFKAYACDCGLLRRLAKLSPEVILSGNSGYTEFKGALTENAILQSLVPQSDVMPYYWSSENRAEVDFILQFPTYVVPVEVKSDTRISGKSLSVYANKFAPPCRIRFSMNNLKENDGLLSCPVPLADWIYKIVGLMKLGK